MISGNWIQFQIWNSGSIQNLRVKSKLKHNCCLNQDLSLDITHLHSKLFIKSNYELSRFQNWGLNYLNWKSIQIKFIIIKINHKVIKRSHFIALILIHTQGSITMIYYTRIKENKYKIEVTYYKLKIQNKILSKSSLYSCSSHLSNLQNKTIRQENLLSKIKM